MRSSIRPVRPVSLRGATAVDGVGVSRMWWLLLALAAAPLPLLAQPAGAVGDGFAFRRPVLSLTVRGGYDRPFASSDIYDFSTRNLTLSKGDFAAAGYQIDIGFRINDRTEVVLSGGQARRQAASEFRKYIDNNDQPIEQTTRLRRMPLSVGVKYALRPPAERIGKFAWIPSTFTPWAGVGVGAMQYSFAQTGDFVDFKTLDVFNDNLASNGWAPMGYAHLGADVRITTRVSLTGDLRYTAAKTKLGSAFSGFNKIDLSGAAATMGFTLRL